MRKAAAVFALAVSVLMCAQGAGAQQRQQRRRPAQTDAELRALRQEIDALRQGQLEIQSELRELKELMQQLAEGAAQGGRRVVSVDDDPSMGETTAKVVLIDFSDYQ
jgi:septal ring factor EnvC (AmiA/AmiB activator)